MLLKLYTKLNMDTLKTQVSLFVWVWNKKVIVKVLIFIIFKMEQYLKLDSHTDACHVSLLPADKAWERLLGTRGVVSAASAFPFLPLRLYLFGALPPEAFHQSSSHSLPHCSRLYAQLMLCICLSPALITLEFFFNLSCIIKL